ncbi:MAG: hypothetical protein Q9172_004144 [Xanthocarpia lactea]
MAKPNAPTTNGRFCLAARIHILLLNTFIPASNVAESFICGNGLFGTSFSRNLQSGSQPCCVEVTPDPILSPLDWIFRLGAEKGREQATHEWGQTHRKPAIEKVKNLKLKRAAEGDDGAGAGIVPLIWVALHDDYFGVRIGFVQFRDESGSRHVNYGLRDQSSQHLQITAQWVSSL